MYLKKICVHGFKSFADKTEIIVEKGMTAIVGPNGSGKSNISDSIKWVLGEQSPKTLRGSKMEDIIFAGTEKRMPLGYADVELIFDNESGRLPVEYKEVSIKRRLFRTGESEYSINKANCRLKDIKELFMDTGIGKDGYSVIGQGKVEEILSPNSDVRRGVFEEAAGIVKFKARKEESIKKLDKTNDNLDRVKDIIHELEIRVEPLKNESEKATKYIEIKENLKNIELNLYVREYEKHKEQLVIFEVQKSEIVKRKQSIINRREELETLIEQEKLKLNELTVQREEFENQNTSLSKSFDSKQSLINVQNEKILLYTENVENIETEIKYLQDTEKEIIEKIKLFNNETNNLLDKLEKEKVLFETLSEDVLEFKIKMETSSNVSEGKRNSLFELHKSLNKYQSDKYSIESIIANFEDRIKQFESEINHEKNEKGIKEKELNNFVSEKNECESLLDIQNKTLEKKINNHENLKEDRREAENRLKSATNELNTVNSKIDFLNNMETLYEGYYKSVQILMAKRKNENLFRGAIKGTVADVIKTEKDYETAIEISLGGAIQNVIVNNTQDAESIIEYLKENKVGRVTFLPINTIKSRELSNEERKLLSMNGVVDTADNLVEVDELYLDIIKNLLGRTIVVENIRDGFRIAKASNNSIKIVSLQGEVINPGGAVTGGHISGKNNSILTRKREIEESKENLKRFKQKCLDIEQDLVHIERELSESSREINRIKIQIEEASKKDMFLGNKIDLCKEQITKIGLLIEKFLSDREFMEEENKNRVAEISILENSIELMNNSINLLEEEIKDIANTNKEEKDQFEVMNESLLSKNNEILQINQEINILEEKCNNAELEIAKNKEMIKLKNDVLNDTGSEVNSAKLQISELQEECNNLNLKLIECEKKLESLKQNFKTKQELINNSQVELNSINKKVTEELDDEYGLTVKTERLAAKIEEISTRLWEDYEMNYAMALSFKNEEVSLNKVNIDVSTLRRELKKLGDVNVNAINEYKEVKERYEFLTKQKQDLIDAKEQLNQVIKELEEKMKNQFAEEFAKIRVLFSEVFQDLFNGGKADVYLEDETDALNSSIEIAAQPPGKKLSKITLLSGGEKALTAIALLFAILKTKPTSFCILDEIEAALDDINVYRFSRYLKEFSKETQFLCITHRKGTMESADTLYGATMEEKGVTKMVSLKLSEF